MISKLLLTSLLAIILYGCDGTRMMLNQQCNNDSSHHQCIINISSISGNISELRIKAPKLRDIEVQIEAKTNNGKLSVWVEDSNGSRNKISITPQSGMSRLTAIAKTYPSQTDNSPIFKIHLQPHGFLWFKKASEVEIHVKYEIEKIPLPNLKEILNIELGKTSPHQARGSSNFVFESGRYPTINPQLQDVFYDLQWFSSKSNKKVFSVSGSRATESMSSCQFLKRKIDTIFDKEFTKQFAGEDREFQKQNASSSLAIKSECQPYPNQILYELQLQIVHLPLYHESKKELKEWSN